MNDFEKQAFAVGYTQRLIDGGLVSTANRDAAVAEIMVKLAKDEKYTTQDRAALTAQQKLLANRKPTDLGSMIGEKINNPTSAFGDAGQEWYNKQPAKSPAVMQALGTPTRRALAALTTGTDVAPGAGMRAGLPRAGAPSAAHVRGGLQNQLGIAQAAPEANITAPYTSVGDLLQLLHGASATRGAVADFTRGPNVSGLMKQLTE